VRRPRCAAWRLRADASCHPQPPRLKSTQDSRYGWMRNGGHVTDSVTVTIPYLEARSVGGGLMTLGHIVFAINVAAILLPRRAMAAAKVVPAE
ncbi:MAG: hypothetical protein AB1592_10250, partial [Pseudomonadota bacterium]